MLALRRAELAAVWFEAEGLPWGVDDVGCAHTGSYGAVLRYAGGPGLRKAL